MSRPRNRAQTLDLQNSKDMEAGFESLIKETQELLLFDKPLPSVAAKIANSSSFYPDLPYYRNEPFTEENMKEIISAISRCQVSDDPSQASFADADNELYDFISYLKPIFENAWEDLAYFWPPRITQGNPQLQAVILLLVQLLHKCASRAIPFLRWLSIQLVPDKYTNKTQSKNGVLKAACLCHRKRKVFTEQRFFWATLDVTDHFTLYCINESADGTKTLDLHMECDVGSIHLSRTGKTVKIFGKDGQLAKRFVPADPAAANLWQMVGTSMNPPFPIFLTKAQLPAPKNILIALNEALLADDFTLVRTMCNYAVCKVSSGTALSEALLDIFAYAGKVDQLLMVLASVEFSASELTHNTVLRGNSQLTNMFKVFFQRWGTSYYQKQLKAVVKYIDERNITDIKSATSFNKSVRTVVFTVLNAITNSLKYVPIQLRHLGSVLKSAVALRFNSKQATYNTLSGYFCLRFISPFLSSPQLFDREIEIKNSPNDVLIPMAQLLMNPFNLIPMQGKYLKYAELMNRGFHDKYFPALIQFVMSIGDCPEAPEYPAPPVERLTEALQTVLTTISSNGEVFANHYKKLVNGEKNSQLSWNLSMFLASYFQQDITATPNSE